MVPTAKKAVRTICTAQMQTDLVFRREYRSLFARHRKRRSAFTLIELVIVLVIVSLLVFTAQMNLYGFFKRGTFKGQVQELISTLEMAVRAASESSSRYEVIIDLTEQTYMLREISSTNLLDVWDEEIIVEGSLDEDCVVEYVLFDDEESTSDGRARFRVGRNGWQYVFALILTTLLK